jgi:protein dithiol:quinone oxidoreductase
MLAIGVAATGALLVAVGSQHLFGMEPCPWCIVQRLVVIAIAVLAFGAAALGASRARGVAVLRGVLGVGVLALSVSGAAAAWHQHTVASRQFSCSFTWADRFLMSLGLDGWWPAMFEVRATCADAAQARLLGLPFEGWSGAFFVLVAAAVLLQGLLALRRARPTRLVDDPTRHAGA